MPCAGQAVRRTSAEVWQRLGAVTRARRALTTRRLEIQIWPNLGPRPTRLGSPPAAQSVAAYARAIALPVPGRQRRASWRRCCLGAHRLTAGPATARRSAWPWRTPIGAASWPSGAPRRWPSRLRRRRRRRGCRRARRPWRSACAPRSPTRRRAPSRGPPQQGSGAASLCSSQAVGGAPCGCGCKQGPRPRSQASAVWTSCTNTGLQPACCAPASALQRRVSSLGGCAAAGAPGERGGGALGQAGGRGGQGRRRARARGGGGRRARGRARGARGRAPGPGAALRPRARRQSVPRPPPACKSERTDARLCWAPGAHTRGRA